MDPKVIDNNDGEITVVAKDKLVRSWSYKDSEEQLIKMRIAHSFAEGWFQAKRSEV